MRSAPRTAAAGQRGRSRLGAGKVRVRALAPAKLNLYLHLLGRRADGYHELDSLVVFADVFDRIEVEAADRLTFACEGPFAAALGPSADNLVVKAARALAGRLGRAPAAGIRLDKTLPVAAGIGGGSSDAAATLKALAALWGADLAAEPLARLALSLGADVPVCLGASASFVGGIGERLDPAPALPVAALVLVNPGVALPTAEVFRARSGPFSEPGRFSELPADAAALARLLAGRANDLAEAATGKVPVIGEVLARLGRAEGCLLARLSGSGPTCFGLFASDGAAAAAAAGVASDRPGWWVKPARMLVRAPDLERFSG